MTLRVQISTRAERDVDRIYDWLARRSKDGAVRWYLSYFASLKSLPNHATGCAIAAEAEKLGMEIRQVHFRTRRGHVYRSLFVIDGNTIHVVSVRGAGQDLADASELGLPLH